MSDTVTAVVTALACGLMGLLVGSFLNVVIARVPVGLSVVNPPSRCPACETAIAPRDNVPVLSFLLLGGRARCCGVAISPRYPLVEVGTALAFAAVAWRFGPSPELVGFLYLAAVSIALGLIDLATFRLPYVIVSWSYPVLAVLLGAASALHRDGSGPLRMVVGGAAVWLFYRTLHAVHPGGMGYGDVRLAGLIGGALGWLGWAQVVVGTFSGFVLGGVGGIVVLAMSRGGWKTQLPFGPYMLAGTWIAIAWGGSMADWYLRAAGL